ncbi:hypothetical protein DSAG12_00957 [Promethearchaeum syntrophicum]|uniref:Uncharacterized protein n=1 Tax=Promethearchaeum syntrophicum TaxID=2594042 RepID=A0A5B9D7P0_9ARCH|nr:hypothetical protein [Candidatus Prometheoarchaeum syntrophicum]QEE15134.1 hypothetical protein DSAG12_00957 [Candidatus Prometheoarchaeum syntrophicum]
MAKNTGVVLGSGVILIIMSIVFRTPGAIAGVVFYWVFYFCCMAIKGDSSDNSGKFRSNSGAKYIDINRKDAVRIICPRCQLESLYKIEESKICRKCGQNLE